MRCGFFCEFEGRENSGAVHGTAEIAQPIDDFVVAVVKQGVFYVRLRNKVQSIRLIVNGLFDVCRLESVIQFVEEIGDGGAIGGDLNDLFSLELVCDGGDDHAGVVVCIC